MKSKKLLLVAFPLLALVCSASVLGCAVESTDGSAPGVAADEPVGEAKQAYTITTTYQDVYVCEYDDATGRNEIHRVTYEIVSTYDYLGRYVILSRTPVADYNTHNTATCPQ
jgi:hypothetical protein